MNGLWSNFFKRTSLDENTLSLLKNTPIFASLSRRELDSINRIIYRRQYDSGDTVFLQGDPGLGMYIIQLGSVAITHRPSGRILADLEQGDFFGEIALLNETPRSASALAKTACTLLCVSQPDLMGLLRRNPKLGVKVLISLSQITGQRLLNTSDDLLRLHEQMEKLKSDGKPESRQQHEATGYPLD